MFRKMRLIFIFLMSDSWCLPSFISCFIFFQWTATHALLASSPPSTWARRFIPIYLFL
jgi:hypothetical protein